MTDRNDLFDFLLQSVRDYWAASTAAASEKPPESIWTRGDVIPVGAFGYVDWSWTCLKRDGTLVTCEAGSEDTPFPVRSHNPVIGLLMQQFPLASAYLRPVGYLVVCDGCRGTGRLRGEVCVCGGLGWVDQMRDPRSNST